MLTSVFKINHSLNLLNTMKNKSPEVFICDCHSTDHQMIFLFSSDEIAGKEFPTVYTHVHLNKKPFLTRLYYGIRYIFGHQSRYGAFDEFILQPEDADRLQDVVNYLKDIDVQS